VGSVLLLFNLPEQYLVTPTGQWFVCMQTWPNEGSYFYAIS